MNQIEEQVFTKSIDIGIWKRFFHYASMFKKEFFMLAGVLIALAIFENIPPLMTKFAIDHFIENNSAEGLGLYALVFIVVVLIQAVIVRFFLYFAGRVETGLSYEIRQGGFNRLQSLSFSYFDRTPVGWIMARMIADTNRLSEVIAWGIVDIAWGFATILVILGAMFVLDPRLALITLAVIPFLGIIAWIFQKRLLKAHRLIRRINSRVTGAFNEGITGAKTSKTLRRESENSREFDDMSSELRNRSVHAGVLSSLFIPLVSMLGAVGTALILTFGSRWVLSGTLLTGTLYAFIIYITRIWDPIRHVSRVMADLQSAQASAERVMALLAEESDIIDQPPVIEAYGLEDGFGQKPWPPFNGHITFKDVSFHYGNDEMILENFNLDVKEGQVIALVGDTGSGKSTIVNLACRFYEPTDGSIQIDGVDYRERPLLWLYNHLGYVLQTPHLFSGTIAENIRYGRLTASKQEIEDAAKLVHAHDFIMKMEKGYETEVGEGGNRLSTGEKQLISFARAVLADPRLFVLDEATSSVDTETEQLIQKAIETVLEGRTSFIIAHRLSTIRQADRILLIEAGHIVEDGTHRELMKKRGRYYQLYSNQFVEDSITSAQSEA